MKEIEIMLQGVLDSAFDMVNTLSEGIEILDSFLHLSQKEVFFKKLMFFKRIRVRSNCFL